MSILIKGMEMPKDGCHHMICIYADGTVSTGGRVYMAIPVQSHGDVVAVRHGRLLNPNPYGECSLCGNLMDIRDGYKYCPSCGAKMDGGQ